MNNNICEKQLEQLRYEVSNEYGDAGFESLNKMKTNGLLDKLCLNLGIEESFKQELTDFLNLLYTEELNEFPALRKIFIHESNFIKIFARYSYELGLFLDNKDVYMDFPNYITSSIKKYGMNIDNIIDKISEFVDMVEDNDKTGRLIHKVLLKFPGNCNDMTKYEEIYENKKINLNDKDHFAYWAERTVYESVVNTLGYTTMWVSRYNGDGYGYDILMHDLLNKKEDMIEVKSGRYEYFALTPNEYKTMLNTKKYASSDYYIYRYFRDGVTGKITLNVLKFDKDKEVLRDISNPNEIYYTREATYNDKGEEKRIIWVEPEEEYIKQIGGKII